MKNKKAILGLMALVIFAAAGATSVMAAGPNLTSKTRNRPPALTAAQKTDMKTKMDAVKSALTANDYNAWVTAEKALNANSPLLTKITADNFSQYTEANNLRTQADTIMKNLGLGGNEGQGFGGPGRGHGGMTFGSKK